MSEVQPLVQEDGLIRLDLLLGSAARERLRSARVAAIGLGGVGGFAVEALARSGVGTLRLVDGDRVEPSNLNRQLHALVGTLGRLKTEVLAERCLGINPALQLQLHTCRYGPDTEELLLEPPLDVVLDAIDSVYCKAHLLDACRRRGIRCVTVMGAARRLDPTQVRAGDLARVENDPLARVVRKRLRRDYDWPREKRWGLPAVYSVEPALPAEGGGFQPDGHKVPVGSAIFVPAAFGLAAAWQVLTLLLPELDPRGGSPTDSGPDGPGGAS